MGLLGRRAEQNVVDDLITRARAGRSGVLVVRGEAGIGKTALLDHARAFALTSAFRVEAATGVESESQFAFAGLHQLCAPLIDRIQALPDPQRSALGVAFGLRHGAPPDRFLVGLAVLSLLADAAEEQPLLCLIDDAQWLDEASSQVMAFVARRLAAERIALLFAQRDPVGGDAQSDPATLAGLPELHLVGIGEEDSRTLLASALGAALDERVRERIIAESRGNPLALLELPRSSRSAQLAGGFQVPDLADVPLRVERSFTRRSSDLPAETQLLLLLAAAEPTGDSSLVWRAAERLELAGHSLGPAEEAGLLDIDQHVRFRHPLVRSAVYRAATAADRRRVHAALADATDAGVDPDRRAWHRAHAVKGPDEGVAAELERSADRARSRGGLSAAAAFLEQATRLTPDDADRARRALEAAHAKHVAGASAAALGLLDIAEAGRLDDLGRARLELLRVRIAFHLTRGDDVPEMALAAARRLAPLNARISRETYLDAIEAATLIGGRDHARRLATVADSARAAPPPPASPEPADLLLDGLVVMFTRGYEASVADLRVALEAFCHDRPRPDRAGRGGSDRWLWLASRTAAALFEDDLIHLLDERNVRLAREAGAFAALPAALVSLSSTLVLTGEFARATELAAEAAAITVATGAAPLRYAELFLAAWHGDQARATELHTAITGTGRRSVEVALADYALAVLSNGMGNYSEASEVAARACESDSLTSVSLTLPELVEAASRNGDTEQAAGAMAALSARAQGSGTAWALGLEARSRALLTTADAADRLYREAIEMLSTCRVVTDLARAHLVYGEWLRREGHRQDARRELRAAHDLFVSIGAVAFAGRAARELRATGEHPRKRSAERTDALTASEVQIARLVATGATSREVAAQLFLSSRTVDAHLRNIFRKLGITSRRQLREMTLP
ncbi:AAA family ATPase [Microbacterium sp. ET2]|uniref:ATP-binding protein n=1 Tax=Microbacterium albipurpureum TaxID=3050384 RepID=UPI00259D2162|nr:AAA family ATPase [Microbacterium sp. ET2 (Ac-2212)]WJL96635.1 AAA family ATPase [Microbacterium sp. ET2 (Ac-2212)]